MTDQEGGWWAAWLADDACDAFGQGLAAPDEHWDDYGSCEPRDACANDEPCWTHSDWDDGPCVCHALDGRYCRVHGRVNDDEPENHDLGGEG